MTIGDLSPVSFGSLPESGISQIRNHVVGFFDRLDHSDTVKSYEFFGGNLEMIRNNDQEVMLSGPADCGKTIACLTKIHQIAWNNPGAQIVIVRKVRADIYSSVCETFHKKILSYPPDHPDCPIKVLGGESPTKYIYPNGSVIWIAGMDRPGRVLSSERDVIYVNQAEQLEAGDWEDLGTRATGRAGYVPYPQLLGDCNPGPPSHWILQRRDKKQLTFIESSHRDNPELFDHERNDWTAEGIKRRDALRTRLTGYKLQRLFHNIWAAPEGAIYEIYDETRHKCKAFPLPLTFPRIVGVDPYGAKISALWAAWDVENRKLHIYREYAEPFGISTPQHAANILDRSVGETIWVYTGGGPSENQARVDYRAAGLPILEPPNIGVWSGIDLVLQLLRDNVIVIHDSCPQLLSEITDYRRKIIHGEPTDTIVNKEQYHMLDSLRYLVAWILGITDDNETEQRVSYNPVAIY